MNASPDPAHGTLARRKAPTMRDVAERAGTSVQTVSNVVNGHLTLMGPGTRARVEEAMAELDYRPNATARGLRSAKTRVIGFLLVDGDTRFMGDPMNSLVMAGVGQVAAERGYGLLIESGGITGTGDGIFAPLLQNRIDGAVLFLSGTSAQREIYHHRMHELGSPCVIIGETADGMFPSVTAANEDGARQLTEHLLDQGHRRIAFISGETSWPMIEQRFAGYRAALEDAGIESTRELQMFRGGYEPIAGEIMANELLELREPPSAVVAANDVLALGAIRAARMRHMKIPDDLAITGFNNFEFAAYLSPSLTTVNIPMIEMGKTAGEILLNSLAGSGETGSREYEAEVLLRKSS